LKLLASRRRIVKYSTLNPVAIAKFDSFCWFFVISRSSKRLFNGAYRKDEREQLAAKLEIAPKDLLEIVSLCDLVRITGVGPVFARIIYDTGIHSAEEFLTTDKYELVEILNASSFEKEQNKFKLRVADIDYCFDLAQFLPLIFEV